MKYLPGIAVNELNGTLKGITAQRWRGLGVFRKKPTPHNPQTPRQMEVRIITAGIAEAWREQLNQGMRTAWNQRAKNYPWTDVFGREIRMTGINLFLKQNFPLADHGLSYQLQPPSTTEPPELDNLTMNPVGTALIIFDDGLPATIVEDWTPFIDIQIAGGFTSLEYLPPTYPPDPLEPWQLNITTEGLPQGRQHQISDFKHAFYVDDVADNTGLLNVFPPIATTRNIVVKIKRYNNHGNFSTIKIFQRIVSRP